jgi:hypothetical protein
VGKRDDVWHSKLLSIDFEVLHTTAPASSPARSQRILKVRPDMTVLFPEDVLVRGSWHLLDLTAFTSWKAPGAAREAISIVGCAIAGGMDPESLPPRKSGPWTSSYVASSQCRVP